MFPRHVRCGMRVLLLLPVLVIGLLLTGPGGAGACACGAVLADKRLEGVDETALVELDGARQAITLHVGGRTEAGDVAFVMPVPARAEFEIADGEVFAELDELSAPRVEYEEVESDGDGGAGAAPPGDVTVTDHAEIGPYEVAQLSGVDSTAVANWLGQNNFTLPPDLSTALTPYLADGWLVIAVRLTADTFTEGLPPMRFTFTADKPVYPMRLSATADHSQPLRLYVLADHRMNVSNPAPAGDAPALTFAGWVDPADLTNYPTLATTVDTRRFLTRYDATLATKQITDDIHLTQATTDDTYRAVVIQTRYVKSSSFDEIVLWLLGIVVVSAVSVGGVWLARRPRHR
jgi:hypothetical protein